MNVELFGGARLFKRLLLAALPTIAVFATVNAVVWHFKSALKDDHRKNLLQVELQALEAIPADKLRSDPSNGEEAKKYWQKLFSTPRAPFMVLSGMSQMYSINDPKPGDQIIAEWLDDFLAPKGVRVVGLAAPNLNNEEALLQLLSLTTESKTLPTSFVYGVCFDKFRHMDIRPGYQELLRGSPSLLSEWRRVATTFAQQFPQASAKMRASLDALAAPQANEQSQTTEDKVRALVASQLPVVSLRKELNGYGQEALFQLRNLVFRIKSSSKRPILKTRYEMNQQFLELMAEVAKRNRIQLVLYVNPLNPVAENPYVASEYVAFKEWLAALTAERHIPFANLENAVPAADWGLREGEVDFKHFKESGHRITAEQLERSFGATLVQTASKTEAANGI